MSVTICGVEHRILSIIKVKWLFIFDTLSEETIVMWFAQVTNYNQAILCWFDPMWSQQILEINLHTYFTYAYEAWLFKYLYFVTMCFQIGLSTCRKWKRSFSSSWTKTAKLFKFPWETYLNKLILLDKIEFSILGKMQWLE